jgi:nitrite reductase/ring-hydroxylating ferredoxin subunit
MFDFLDEQQTGRRVLVQVDDAFRLLLRGDQSVRSSNNVCPDKGATGA